MMRQLTQTADIFSSTEVFSPLHVLLGPSHGSFGGVGPLALLHPPRLAWRVPTGPLAGRVLKAAEDGRLKAKF